MPIYIMPPQDDEDDPREAYVYPEDLPAANRESGDEGTNYEVTFFHMGWRVWYDPKPVHQANWEWSAVYVGNDLHGWSALRDYDHHGRVFCDPDADPRHVFGATLDEVLENIDELERIKRRSRALN